MGRHDTDEHVSIRPELRPDADTPALQVADAFDAVVREQFVAADMDAATAP